MLLGVLEFCKLMVGDVYIHVCSVYIHVCVPVPVYVCICLVYVFATLLFSTHLHFKGNILFAEPKSKSSTIN